jgi:hypothetical protein
MLDIDEFIFEFFSLSRVAGIAHVSLTPRMSSAIAPPSLDRGAYSFPLVANLPARYENAGRITKTKCVQRLSTRNQLLIICVFFRFWIFA